MNIVTIFFEVIFFHVREKHVKNSARVVSYYAYLVIVVLVFLIVFEVVVVVVVVAIVVVVVVVVVDTASVFRLVSF